MLKKKNFCVSLTTVPSRFKSVQKTLISIEKQILKPDKIFLNIPNNFRRFENHSFNINHLINNFENLEITKCIDYGPGTKLLGSLEKILEYEYVVLIDDDHLYDKIMLKIFHDQFCKNKNDTYSFCVYQVLDCQIGQGADGFLINTKFVKDIKSFFDYYVMNNEKLFYNDDLWISVYINKILKKNIINLFSLIKQNTFFIKKSIYKKHTKIDALIETYNSNRKLARKLKFKENCEEYLSLKNKTKNFEKI